MTPCQKASQRRERIGMWSVRRLADQLCQLRTLEPDLVLRAGGGGVDAFGDCPLDGEFARQELAVAGLSPEGVNLRKLAGLLRVAWVLDMMLSFGFVDRTVLPTWKASTRGAMEDRGLIPGP